MSCLPDREPDLVVTVYGDPKTKGSVTAFIPRRGDGSMVTRPNGDPMVVKTDDTGARGKQWLTTVAEKVALEMQASGMPAVAPKVPIVLEMVFYRPRAASHYGTGRNADLLKASAPAYPATKPDVDKLTRAILDALKGVAWHDDGQVIGAPAWKEFGTPARVELRMWRLEASVGPIEPTSNAQNALFAGIDV
jgi:Holliday junction resolvase RusA-like endonuclease